MIKVITSDSLNFSDPVASMIKISSRGLLGADKRLMEKRAGEEFTYELTKLAAKLPSDEPLIHLLAMGATEAYGPNRNGDGFTRDTCRNYHDTFVKNAYFYRDHKNKDPLKSYGRVKLSAYHEPMQRIELVVALNGSEKAASRNNGLFADKEMEKLAAGKDIPVSMACRIPFDVCSWCGNKAPTREQYCSSPSEGGMCKAGGLKSNIGTTVDMDGKAHQLHADNPNPTFFDISNVFRPADRIAYVSGMLKAASNRVVGGAEMAEALGVTIPYDLLVDKAAPSRVQRAAKVAYMLADMESALESGEQLLASDNLVHAFSRTVQASDNTLPKLAREKFAHTLKALADSRIILPLDQFIQLTAGYTAEKAAAAADVVQRELPGVYTRMIGKADFTDMITESPYTPASASSPAFRLWAEKNAEALSLKEAHVRRRVTQAAIRQEDTLTVDRSTDYIKSAHDRGAAGAMAEQYALYKLAFLGAIPESDNEMRLTASLALLQNYAK
jgi:hypothetical protein